MTPDFTDQIIRHFSRKDVMGGGGGGKRERENTDEKNRQSEREAQSLEE